MERELGYKGPCRGGAPFPLEGGRIGVEEGLLLPPFGWRKEGSTAPPCGAPPSPLNLYILEVQDTLKAQVLEPPLVPLVLVLVGPS